MSHDIHINECVPPVGEDLLSVFIAPRAFNLLPGTGKAIADLRELVKHRPDLTKVVNQSFNTDKPE